MEASNVKHWYWLQRLPVTTPFSIASSGEGMGTESMLLLFDDIWMKQWSFAAKAARRYHAQL